MEETNPVPFICTFCGREISEDHLEVGVRLCSTQCLQGYSQSFVTEPGESFQSSSSSLRQIEMEFLLWKERREDERVRRIVRETTMVVHHTLSHLEEKYGFTVPWKPPKER